MSQQSHDDPAAVAERIRDASKVQDVLKRAARDAVLDHARAGRKIAIWRDNRVVWELPQVEDGRID